MLDVLGHTHTNKKMERYLTKEKENAKIHIPQLRALLGKKPITHETLCEHVPSLGLLGKVPIYDTINFGLYWGGMIRYFFTLYEDKLQETFILLFRPKGGPLYPFPGELGRMLRSFLDDVYTIYAHRICMIQMEVNFPTEGMYWDVVHKLGYLPEDGFTEQMSKFSINGDVEIITYRRPTRFELISVRSDDGYSTD
jgi:hypothetical protein